MTSSDPSIDPFSRPATPTCPACGQAVTPREHKRLWQLYGPQVDLTRQQEALERQRCTLREEREQIAANATAAERRRWEQLRERAAQHQQKAIAREVAAAKAKANAESERRVREARRAAGEAQRAIVGELRAQLRTVEQRRQRDESKFNQTIVALRQRAESRDQGHFGADGEQGLVQALRERFPGDVITHRGKGGDVLQTVMDAGKVVTKILHEVKNRGSWQRDYLVQIQRDMEIQGVKHGVLVSRTLPGGRSGMCMIGGIIVVVPALAAEVVTVLRDGLIAISRLELSEDGKSSKMDALFEYLRGEDFRAAIERVQRKVCDLQEALGKEKSQHHGWWAARETAYGAILRNAAGIESRVHELLGGTSTPTKDLKANGTSKHAVIASAGAWVGGTP
jgi:hypothetical protein